MQISVTLPRPIGIRTAVATFESLCFSFHNLGPFPGGRLLMFPYFLCEQGRGLSRWAESSCLNQADAAEALKPEKDDFSYSNNLFESEQKS